MIARLTVGLAALVLLAARADAQQVFSGPQPGEKLASFRVLGFAGPNAGKEVQLLGPAAASPTMLVFVHELSRPALQLLRPLDQYASKLAKDGLVCHFVWLSADKTQTEQYLNQARGSLALASPVSISVDGQEGPGNYGLNRKVALTVLAAKDEKVIANFAIVQPNETDAPRILQAVARMMGKPAPTPSELRPDVGKAKAKTDPPTRPNANLPGRTPSDPELVGLMRQMIQPMNDEARVAEVAAQMKKWAGDDAARKTDLTEFCKRIVYLKYGSEAAQKVLKQMAGN